MAESEKVTLEKFLKELDLSGLPGAPSITLGVIKGLAGIVLYTSPGRTNIFDCSVKAEFFGPRLQDFMKELEELLQGCSITLYGEPEAKEGYTFYRFKPRQPMFADKLKAILTVLDEKYGAKPQ